MTDPDFYFEANSEAEAIAAIKATAAEIGLIAEVVCLKNPFTGVDEMHVNLIKADDNAS